MDVDKTILWDNYASQLIPPLTIFQAIVYHTSSKRYKLDIKVDRVQIIKYIILY